MREPIEVNYEPDSDDWLVTATGRGKTLTEKAPGLIAARDRADQLVEKLAPEEEHRTVVHLLNGDALAFTSAYLSARLAKPTETPTETPTEAPTETPESAAAPEPKPGPKPEPPKKKPEASAPPTEAKVPSPTPRSEAQKASTS